MIEFPSLELRGSQPPEYREWADIAWQHLFALHSLIDRVAAAIALFDYSTQEIMRYADQLSHALERQRARQLAGILHDGVKESPPVSTAWGYIAADAVAQAIGSFEWHLNELKKLENDPIIQGRPMNAQAAACALAQFKTLFPKAKQMRNASAHQSEIFTDHNGEAHSGRVSNRLVDIKSKKARTLVSGIAGNIAYFTRRGEIHELTIAQSTVDAIVEIYHAVNRGMTPLQS